MLITFDIKKQEKYEQYIMYDDVIALQENKKTQKNS